MSLQGRKKVKYRMKLPSFYLVPYRNDDGFSAPSWAGDDADGELVVDSLAVDDDVDDFSFSADVVGALGRGT